MLCTDSTGKNFNSHPREGGDKHRPAFGHHSWYFNSHPREGGDP